MVTARADRYCFVLYPIQSRERTWKQNNSTKGHDTSNILKKPRVRTEVDAAFEKMLDPIAESPATGNSWQQSLIFLYFFGTGGSEMEQRVIVTLRKDFQVDSEEWNDVTFTGQRVRWTKDPQSGSCIEVSQHKALDELEEMSVERNTKKEKLLHCTPAMHSRYRSLLG